MIDYRVNAARRRKLGYRRLKSYVTSRPSPAYAEQDSAVPLAGADPSDSWRMVAPFSHETLPRFLANKLRYSFLYKAVGFCIVLFCVLVSSFLAVTYSQIQVGIRIAQGVPVAEDDTPGNLIFLVLGADEFKGDRGRSDAIMLVNVDMKTLRIRALSVPRDSAVEFDYKGRKLDKLNHAYFFGGAELASRAVQDYTSVAIDYFGVINYQLFERVVDLAGGVPIDVEKRMDYDDNAGNLHIHLKSGPQVLSGVQAKGYVRFRNDALGDVGRMQRQQQFAKAFLARLKSPKVVALLALNIHNLFEYVQTDVPLEVVLGLLYRFKDFSPKDLEVKAIPATPTRLFAPRYGRQLSFMESTPSDVASCREWLLSISATPETSAAAQASAPLLRGTSGTAVPVQARPLPASSPSRPRP